MANGFTPDQEAFIERVAYEVVEKAGPRLIKMHLLACPHGRAITKWKWVTIGVAIGCGVTGLAGGLSMAGLVARLFGT